MQQFSSIPRTYHEDLPGCLRQIHSIIFPDFFRNLFLENMSMDRHLHLFIENIIKSFYPRCLRTRNLREGVMSWYDFITCLFTSFHAIFVTTTLYIPLRVSPHGLYMLAMQSLLVLLGLLGHAAQPADTHQAVQHFGSSRGSYMIATWIIPSSYSSFVSDTV